MFRLTPRSKSMSIILSFFQFFCFRQTRINYHSKPSIIALHLAHNEHDINNNNKRDEKFQFWSWNEIERHVFCILIGHWWRLVYWVMCSGVLYEICCGTWLMLWIPLPGDFFLNPHKRAATRPYPTSKVFARARDFIFLFRMQCRVKKSPRKNIILRHE